MFSMKAEVSLKEESTRKHIQLAVLIGRLFLHGAASACGLCVDSLHQSLGPQPCPVKAGSSFTQFQLFVVFQGAAWELQPRPWFWLSGAHHLVSRERSAIAYLCISELVLQFEDAMGESSVQVSVRDFFDTDSVKHLVVRSHLQALELVDSDLAVVNGHEIDEFLVLLDVNVKLLNGGRIRVDIF